MLRSLREVLGYELAAQDGRIGRVEDFQFNAETWGVELAVVQLGTWLDARRIILPAAVCGRPNWKNRTLPVNMTMEQVENCRPVEVRRVMSVRSHEKGAQNPPEGWSYFRMGEVPHLIAVPTPVESSAELLMDAESPVLPDQPELRSAGQVFGFRILACGEDAGTLDDFIIDDTRWTIKFLIRSSGKILTGRKVMFAPLWVSSIDVRENKMRVAINRETLENGHEYDPADPVNHRLEEVLYDYHGRPRFRL